MKMKLLFGKEIVKELNFDVKDHTISLEDDREFKELKIEPQIFCFFSREEYIKMIKFIKDVQILGVDNEAVRLMYQLKEGLIEKFDEDKIENIINHPE